MLDLRSRGHGSGHGRARDRGDSSTESDRVQCVLADRLVDKQEVTGSSPVSPTSRTRATTRVSAFFGGLWGQCGANLAGGLEGLRLSADRVGVGRSRHPSAWAPSCRAGRITTRSGVPSPFAPSPEARFGGQMFVRETMDSNRGHHDFQAAGIGLPQRTISLQNRMSAVYGGFSGVWATSDPSWPKPELKRWARGVRGPESNRAAATTTRRESRRPP